MRQGSSVPSSTNHAEMQGLHPILQVALDSLDVELEEELTRYRRQRYRQSRLGGHQATLSWKSPGEKSKATSPSLDLPKFGYPSPHSQVDQPGLPSTDRTPTPPQPSLLTARPSVEKGKEKGEVSHPVNQALNQLEPVSNATVSNTLGWAAQPQVNRTQPGGSTATPLSHAALATIAPEPSSEPATQANLARSDDEEAPEDYLESTEELLRSIAEETPDLRAERESNLLDSLLTPLGIGSMLLLLLSSATLGYVIMHPSSLDLLTAQDTASKTEADPTAQTAPTGAASIADTPNLAADEFVDLNLDTLSTVPKAGSPSTGTQPSGSQASGVSSSNATATNSSASGKSSSNPDSIAANSGSSNAPPVDSFPADPVAAAPAEPSSYTEPTYTEPAYTEPAYTEPAYTEPAAIDPAPAPETSSAATTPSAEAPPMAAATSSRSGNYYYVVTPYSGDPSLEEARAAVPDAYVRNFSSGASVQLGAFSDPTKAESMLQQLQEQGISAEIYQPQ